MGKKEQVPALAIFVRGSLWVWSATSRGRPPDGGLALAVFHMVHRVPAAPNLFVHPPADLRKVLLPPSSRPARLLRLLPHRLPCAVLRLATGGRVLHSRNMMYDDSFFVFFSYLSLGGGT